MSDSQDRKQIDFKVGTGNQSAICGGVTPIKLVDPDREQPTREVPRSGKPAEAPAQVQER